MHMEEGKMQGAETKHGKRVRKSKIRNRRKKVNEQGCVAEKLTESEITRENVNPSLDLPEKRRNHPDCRPSGRSLLSRSSDLDICTGTCKEDLALLEALGKSLETNVAAPCEPRQNKAKKQDVRIRRRRSLSTSTADEFVATFLEKDENIRKRERSKDLIEESKRLSLFLPSETKVYLADPEFLAAPDHTSYDISTKNYTDSFFDHMRGRPVKRSSFLTSLNDVKRSSSVDRKPKRPSISIHSISSHAHTIGSHGSFPSCSNSTSEDYSDTLLDSSKSNVNHQTKNHTDSFFDHLRGTQVKRSSFLTTLNDIKKSSMDRRPRRPSMMTRSVGSFDSCGSLSSLGDDIVDAIFEDMYESEISNVDTSNGEYLTKNHTDSFFDHMGGKQVKRSSFLATLNSNRKPFEQRLKRPSIVTMSFESLGSCGSCSSFDEDFTGPVAQLQIPALSMDQSLKVLQIEFDRI